MSRDQFPLNREFKNGFIYFAPGITYTLPLSEGSFSNQVVDTTYTHTSNPKGGSISYAFELGWYHTFENPVFFHYIDAGIAYRKFRGNSEFERSATWESNRFSETAESSYNIDQITGVIRIIRSQQLGKFTFFTFGPGLNFDYHLNDDRSVSPFVEGVVDRRYKAQIHLQMGLGIRLTERLIFQPQLELPILDVIPQDGISPAHQYIDGTHYPLLLSFRFMLLRKDLMNCNAPTFTN